MKKKDLKKGEKVGSSSNGSDRNGNGGVVVDCAGLDPLTSEEKEELEQFEALLHKKRKTGKETFSPQTHDSKSGKETSSPQTRDLKSENSLDLVASVNSTNMSLVSAIYNTDLSDDDSETKV